MEGRVVNIKKKIFAAVMAFLIVAPLSAQAAQQLTWYPMETSTAPPVDVSASPPVADTSTAQITELLKKMAANPGQDTLLTSLLVQQQSAMTSLLTTMSQQQAANAQANLLMTFMAMKPEQQMAFMALMGAKQVPQQVHLSEKKELSVINTSATTPLTISTETPSPAALPAAVVPVEKTKPVLAKKEKPKKTSQEVEKTEDTNPLRPIVENSYTDRVKKILDEFQTENAITLSSGSVPTMVVVNTPQKTVIESIRDAYQDGLGDVGANGAEAGFSYAPSQIFTVWCKVGYLTDIRLQPGEELQYIGGGDTVRWLVDKAASGNGATRQWHVYIKPLRGSIETNIIINTDRRAYQLYAKTDGAGYNPMVAWVYPQDQLEAINKELGKNAIASASRLAQNNRGQVSPESLNFDYRVSAAAGAENWTPISVYDDGQKTYLKMSAAMTYDEAPALFVKDGRNGMMIVNFRLRKGVFIVDRLFNEAELRNGKITVNIKRTTGRN